MRAPPAHFQGRRAADGPTSFIDTRRTTLCAGSDVGMCHELRARAATAGQGGRAAEAGGVRAVLHAPLPPCVPSCGALPTGAPPPSPYCTGRAAEAGPIVPPPPSQLLPLLWAEPPRRAPPCAPRRRCRVCPRRCICPRRSADNTVDVRSLFVTCLFVRSVGVLKRPPRAQVSASRTFCGRRCCSCPWTERHMMASFPCPGSSLTCPPPYEPPSGQYSSTASTAGVSRTAKYIKNIYKKYMSTSVQQHTHGV